MFSLTYLELENILDGVEFLFISVDWLEPKTINAIDVESDDGFIGSDQRPRVWHDLEFNIRTYNTNFPFAPDARHDSNGNAYLAENSS